MKARCSGLIEKGDRVRQCKRGATVNINGNPFCKSHSKLEFESLAQKEHADQQDKQTYINEVRDKIQTEQIRMKDIAYQMVENDLRQYGMTKDADSIAVLRLAMLRREVKK